MPTCLYHYNGRFNPGWCLLLLMACGFSACGPSPSTDRISEQRGILLGRNEAGQVVSVDFDARRLSNAKNMLQNLRGFPALRTLNVNFVKLAGTHLQVLEKLPHLEALYLRIPELGDADLQHLIALSKLQVLDLRVTKVSDMGMVSLRHLSKLQMLDLGFTHVTDAGLQHLQALPNLKEVRLDGTGVTEAGVKIWIRQGIQVFR